MARRRGETTTEGGGEGWSAAARGRECAARAAQPGRKTEGSSLHRHQGRETAAAVLRPPAHVFALSERRRQDSGRRRCYEHGKVRQDALPVAVARARRSGRLCSPFLAILRLLPLRGRGRRGRRGRGGLCVHHLRMVAPPESTLCELSFALCSVLKRTARTSRKRSTFSCPRAQTREESITARFSSGPSVGLTRQNGGP